MSFIIYSAFNPPPRGYSDIECPLDEDMTDQSFYDDCDINHIVKTYNPLTGHVRQLIQGERQPFYADFSGDLHGDFQFAQNFLLYAEDMFMQLPAELRAKYENNAGIFLNEYDKNPEKFVEFFPTTPPGDILTSQSDSLQADADKASDEPV